MVIMAFVDEWVFHARPRPGLQMEKQMSEEFLEIAAEAIADNPFRLFDKDWTLITAGTPDKFNTMTASWGGMGVLWQKNVANVYVRPQRYTYEFLEREDYFTLCFFEEKYRLALNLFGAASGRDLDKVKASGLTPVVDASGAVYYSEARLVLILKKIYFQDLDPARVRNIDLADIYAAGEAYHRLYLGEIVKVLRKA